MPPGQARKPWVDGDPRNMGFRCIEFEIENNGRPTNSRDPLDRGIRVFQSPKVRNGSGEFENPVMVQISAHES